MYPSDLIIRQIGSVGVGAVLALLAWASLVSKPIPPRSALKIAVMAGPSVQYFCSSGTSIAVEIPCWVMTGADNGNKCYTSMPVCGGKQGENSDDSRR